MINFNLEALDEEIGIREIQEIQNRNISFT
jgi:hypothetical protein